MRIRAAPRLAPEISERLRSFGAGSSQAQLLHTRLERGGLDAEHLCGPAGTTDTPSRLLQHLQDMPALRGLEGSGGRLRWCGRLYAAERDVQRRAACEDHRALDYVAQLAHVRRPGVSYECRHGVVGDTLDGLTHRLAALFYELPGEQRNVLAARAQRWHRDRKDVQPVVKVLPKPAFLDRGGKVAVRSRDHACRP